MKQKANKSARIWEGKGKKPSNKQGLQYLCFFLYVQDKFIHLNFFFKTHSTKRKKKINHWQKKEKKTIVQCCPSVFNAAGFFIMGDRWGGGGSEMKNKTHWKADWVCIGLGNLSLAKRDGILCNISLIYWNSYCTSEGQWKRKKKTRACARQKENTPKAQYTTHDPSVCTNMHAVTWQTHLSSQAKPVSSLICLYI